MSGSGTIYDSPAKNWVEAMPLGNGSLGAMVYFDTGAETISMNHDTLWSGLPKEYGRNARPGARESFERARRLALEGRFNEAQTEIEDNFLDFCTEKYMPLGDILLNFPTRDYSSYKRRLDFGTATASLEYTSGVNTYKRRCFVSKPDDVCVYSIFGEKKTVDVSVTFSSKLRGKLTVDGDMLIFDGECPGYSSADKVPDDVFEYYDDPKKAGIKFRSIILIKHEGGREFSSEYGIGISKATSVHICFITRTNFESPFVSSAMSQKDYKTEALEAIRAVAQKDTEKIYEDHKKDFSSLYDLVKLDLGTSGKDDVPTDKRLRDFMETKDDKSLYTLLFDFARYLTISASRSGTQAMNLQGIWNEKLAAPWRGNYTVNINTQMNYWPTLPSGLFECAQPLFELIKKAVVTGREVARHYYGARGFVVHHNIDLWGHSSAVYWKAMWGFWQGGSGWLTRHLYEYYEYTLDMDFLRDTAYPIIKEAALFYMDIMSEVEDGRLAIVPGTSPENSFIDKDGNKVAVAKYSTMMNSIAYETIENAVKCCKILDVDADFAREAAGILSRIPPLKVGSDGRLLEWDDEYIESEITHRHVSHLYALHPADMITQKTPHLMDAARKTLEVRGDDGTGWSLGWKINFYARLGDGDGALRLLERQLSFVQSDVQSIQAHNGSKSGTYTNLFDAHPPFQIDGNFGLASGIYEMLARVVGDELYLLPALPEKWSDGSIEGMRIKGGNILSMTWRDGKLVYYEICGKKPLRVYCRGELLEDIPSDIS